MFVINGVYRWGEKFIGYKKGFCYHCKTNTVWHRLRFFPIIHFFWIPLIPLGIFKVWMCDNCHQNPKGSSTIGGAVVLGVAGVVLSIISLFLVLTGIHSDPEMFWFGVFLFCFSLVLFGVMIYTIRLVKNRKLIYEITLNENESLLEEPCLYCKGEIQRRNKPACIDCGARVYETVDEFAELKTG